MYTTKLGQNQSTKLWLLLDKRCSKATTYIIDI